MTPDDFPEFFSAVHGHPPFAWQSALADRVTSQESWPTALDVPTGMGKTAVLDIAIFALALQADRAPEDRTACTRTFLVVDRRVIVDQAHERAMKIAEALHGASEGVLGEVASALSRIAGPQGHALSAVRMRGGVTWASRWLTSAAQPAIVTGTVDQLGSRMLFRGYGVSDGMKPINAALCGTDSLLLLDEAHLSQPFLQTVRDAGLYERAASVPVLLRQPRTVLLSATLPEPVDEAPADTFVCDPASETSSIAQARLTAVKRTRLLDVKAKGELAPVLTSLAQAALGRGADRVAVLCNTVAMAREVFDALHDAPADRALLIGRCRGTERDVNAETWVRGRLAAVDPRPEAEPLVVVATQTVEVGADMDVDVLISEACPLDALTQRLGRLNRLGRTPEAEATVVWDDSVHGQEEQTPVYGAATRRSWEWLLSAAGVSESVTVTPAKVHTAWPELPSLDLGVRGALSELTARERAALTSDTALAPAVLSPVLDIWCRTRPIPLPDQPVAPFLHGLVPFRPEVQVCWRIGLQTPEEWEEELTWVRPTAHETVAVSLSVVRRMLAGQSAGSEVDLEGALLDEPLDPFGELPSLRGRIVSLEGNIEEIRDKALRPGVTLVLDAEHGGHDAWGWTGRLDERDVLDVGDLTTQGPGRLRLRQALWQDVLPADDPRWGVLTDEEATRADVKALVDALAESCPKGPRASLLRSAGTALDGGARVRTLASGLLITWPSVRTAGASVGDERVASSSVDETLDVHEPGATSQAPHVIGLERHLRDVGGRAGREGRRLGLAPALVNALELAGLAHDLGKADPRFQLVLHGGNRYRQELSPILLAKSPVAVSARRDQEAVRVASGWPRGMRHESISAAMVRALEPEQPELFAELDAELVVHLVASHHGHARPLLPPISDPEPQDVTATLPLLDAELASVDVTVRSDDGIVDWDHPARFETLCRRYGRWGLALLETVLRLADMAESEAYDLAAHEVTT